MQICLLSHKLTTINTDTRRQYLLDNANKLNSCSPFLRYSERDLYINQRVYNISISQCFSCHELAIWLQDRLSFPQIALIIEASTDMPANIKLDFEEARQIFPSSPS